MVEVEVSGPDFAIGDRAMSPLRHCPILASRSQTLSGGRRERAESQTAEQEPRSAALIRTHRLLLLAEDNEAVEADDSLCARALAAASAENVQVADGPSKLISGQGRIQIDKTSSIRYMLAAGLSSTK